MPFVERPGARIYYEWRGPAAGGTASALPVLLLRGLSRSLRFWLDLADLLSAHYRVLLLDHRGIGRSPDDGRLFRVATLADDVAAVLDAAGVERALVFGLSLGGMVAQELVLRHPAKVARLVLGGTTPGPRHGRRPPLPAIAALLAASALPREQALRLTGPLVVACRGAALGTLLARWSALLRDEPVSRWTVLRQLLAAQAHDTWARLPDVRVPTLCLAGGRDRLMPTENTRLLAGRIPGAQHRELPECGHDIAADDPHGTYRELDRFFREASP